MKREYPPTDTQYPNDPRPVPPRYAAVSNNKLFGESSTPTTATGLPGTTVVVVVGIVRLIV